MRRLNATFVAVLMGVVACGGDGTGPGSAVVGDYVLSAINGQPIPFEFPAESLLTGGDTSVARTTWVYSVINLRHGGRAETNSNGLVHYHFASDPTPQSFYWSEYYSGHWQASGATVHVVFDSLARNGGAMALLASPVDLALDNPGNGALVRHYSYRHASLGAAPPPADYPFLYHKE